MCETTPSSLFTTVVTRWFTRLSTRASTQSSTKPGTQTWRGARGVAHGLAPIQHHTQLKVEIFRGYDFTGGQISHFPIDF